MSNTSGIYSSHGGCLTGAVLTYSPLTAATRFRYSASACEMVMWSPAGPIL